MLYNVYICKKPKKQVWNLFAKLIHLHFWDTNVNKSSVKLTCESDLRHIFCTVTIMEYIFDSYQPKEDEILSPYGSIEFMQKQLKDQKSWPKNNSTNLVITKKSAQLKNIILRDKENIISKNKVMKKNINNVTTVSGIKKQLIEKYGIRSPYNIIFYEHSRLTVCDKRFSNIPREMKIVQTMLLYNYVLNVLIIY